MSKSLLGGTAAAALLSASLIFYAAGTTLAEPLAPASHQPSISQQPGTPPAITADEATSVASGADVSKSVGESTPAGVEINPGGQAKLLPSTIKKADDAGVATPAPQSFVATAYTLRGRTASGKPVNRGLIAADRRLLPLGTRVRLEAGNYSGEYLVADTGGAVRGRKIDIWMPNGSEAMRFGRRAVKLTVLTHVRKPNVRPTDGRR